MQVDKILTLKSPAKLNLFLHINGRRQDGYHELQTAFQFVDFCDQITLDWAESGIELLTPIAGVNTQDNLVVKAALLLQKASGCQQGCRIAIDKKIPMGGGLGGGSSNAATILVGLNILWDLKMSRQQLAELGLQLGADVPVFVHGFAAMANGVGEQLTPITPEEPWYLVTHPNVSISTAAIFAHPDLPRHTPKIDDEKVDFLVSKNDCQSLVLKLYPEVANLLARLLEYAPSKMTGTGACLFSRCESLADAQALQAQLPEQVFSFIARGCNTSPLYQDLFTS